MALKEKQKSYRGPKFLKCKESGKIRGIVFGDVHLGHDTVKSIHILQALDHTMKQVDIKTLDLIIIEGDLFDQSMNYHHDDVLAIEKWFSKLFKIAAKYNIAIRIVEGTPSHDMKQSVNLVKLNEVMGNIVDLKYYDDIALEINDELGYSCIYVPDEIDSPHINCFNRARDLLTEAGLEKATFAIMHGSFDYQFPSYMNVDSHDSKLWSTIVEKWIFIGHVHTRSVYKNIIIASGSVERLRHGEQEKKGMTYFEATDSDKSQKFLVNEISILFNTYKVNKVDDETIADIDAKLEKLPNGSHVRFMGPDRSILSGFLSHFDFKFDKIKFKIEVEDPDKKKKDQLTYPTIKNLVVPKHLTRENTVSLLIDRVKDRLDETKLARFKEIMEDVA
tara:strand:- start:162308 stop:163477 length:1170 start_codon:yes stop_codon:yes gene_type:complete